MNNRRLDLTGKRFGRLTAVRDVGSVHKRRLWLCQCDCGNTHKVQASRLNRGKVNSCGCLHSPRFSTAVAAANNRKKRPFGKAAFNSLYSDYRYSARARGIQFELSVEVFKELTLGNCAYCGVEPFSKYEKKNVNGPYIYNGVDRVDNNLGYTIHNCVPCCKFCNYTKNKGTREEFLAWIERLKSLGR